MHCFLVRIEKSYKIWRFCMFFAVFLTFRKFLNSDWKTAHETLTGLDTKYQPWTQQKKILVFDFIASNELTIHMDSLNGQIFPPCPPTGSGGPI